MKVIKTWHNLLYDKDKGVDVEENDAGEIRTKWTKDSQDKWGSWQSKTGGPWSRELIELLNTTLPTQPKPNEEQSKGIDALKKWMEQ